MIIRPVLIALMLTVSSACAETFGIGTLEIKSASKIHGFDIEIADDESERSRGLMFREELTDGHGMLFIYPSPRIASFWMKNTLIPLDMLFISPENRIVKIARETKPHSLNPIISDGPVLTVFEIAGGQAEALGIKVGDTVSWSVTLEKK